MNLFNRKRGVILTVIILFISLMTILSSVCLDWVTYKAFQYGFFKYPKVGGVSIVMRKSWYPTVSTGSILGLFVHSDDPYIMYKKNAGCFDEEGWMHFSRVPESNLDTSRLNESIISTRHFPWGDAEIVKSHKGDQIIGGKSGEKTMLVFIRNYSLFITLNELSYLNEIVKIGDGVGVSNSGDITVYSK